MLEVAGVEEKDKVWKEKMDKKMGEINGRN